VPPPWPPEATAPLSFGSAAKIACAFAGGPFASTDCSSTGIAINPATNVAPIATKMQPLFGFS
jgi:hypothetical protein